MAAPAELFATEEKNIKNLETSVANKKGELTGIKKEITELRKILDTRLKRNPTAAHISNTRGPSYNRETKDVTVNPVDTSADMASYDNMLNGLLSQEVSAKSELADLEARLERSRLMNSSAKEIYDLIDKPTPSLKELVEAVNRFDTGSLNEYQRGKLVGKIAAKVKAYYDSQISSGKTPAEVTSQMRAAGVSEQYVSRLQEVAKSDTVRRLVESIRNGATTFNQASIRRWNDQMAQIPESERNYVKNEIIGRIRTQLKLTAGNKVHIANEIKEMENGGWDEEYTKYHKEELKKIEDKEKVTKIKTDIDGMKAKLTTGGPPLTGVSSLDEFRKIKSEILDEIAKIVENKPLIEHLQTALRGIYVDMGDIKPGTEFLRDIFRKNATDANWNDFAVNELKDLEEKRKTGKSEANITQLLTDIGAFVFATPVTNANYDSIKDFIKRADGNEKALKAIKEKVGQYYHTQLTEPVDRNNFVLDAQARGVSPDIIGEYLWKETQERISKNDELMKRLVPVMQDFVAEGVNSGNYNTFFYAEVLPALQDEARGGIPRDAIEELRLRFFEACRQFEVSGEASSILFDITKAYTDHIVVGLLPDTGDWVDPYASDRGAGGIAVPANVINEGRINFGEIRAGLIAEIDAQFSTLDPQRQEVLVEQAYKTILEDIRETMPDVKEIRKIRAERDEIQKQVDKQMKKYRDAWFEDILKGSALIFNIPLIGILLGGAWAPFGSFLSAAGTYLTSDKIGKFFGFELGALGIGGFIGLLASRAEKHGKFKAKADELKVQLNEKQMDLEAKTTDVAAKRGIELSKKRAHFDGIARTILAPALSAGREAIESRQEFIRRQLVGASVPQLARL